jgi:hypothetical protein
MTKKSAFSSQHAAIIAQIMYASLASLTMVVHASPVSTDTDETQELSHILKNIRQNLKSLLTMSPETRRK